MAKIEVKVPDIGDFKDVPVIEILVKPGDAVKAEQPLLTLESDKATLEVPAPSAGVVATIVAKVGDKVSMGTPLLTLEAEAGAPAAAAPPPPKAEAAPPPAPAAAQPPAAPAPAAPRGRRGEALDHGRRLLRRHSPARRRAVSRASSTSTSPRCQGTGEKGRITVADVKIAARGGGRRRRRRGCPRFRPSISPNSGRSRPCRCRASSASPARVCTPPGSTSPTSPIATTPTSPSSRRSASRSTTRPRPTRRRPIASRCCRC